MIAHAVAGLPGLLAAEPAAQPSSAKAPAVAAPSAKPSPGTPAAPAKTAPSVVAPGNPTEAPAKPTADAPKPTPPNPTTRPADPPAAPPPGATAPPASPTPITAPPAMPGPAAPAAHTGSRPPRAVQEAEPPLYYIKDKHGNLVGMPGYTLDDFEALLELRRQVEAGAAAPAYTIDSMVIEGKIRDQRAELSALLRITVRGDGWVRVPLRLPQAVIQGEPTHQGTGEFFVHFDHDAEGYAAWFRGQSGEHRLTIPMAVPVQRTGQSSRLRMTVPRATTAKFQGDVSLPDAVLAVSDGAALAASERLAGGGTRFVVEGLSGNCDFTWQPAAVGATESPRPREVEGIVVSRIDERGIHSDVRLTLRMLSGPMGSFRVRLPAGAELVREATSGYTVDLLPGDDHRKLVEVRFPQKRTDATEVHLATWVPFDLVGAGGEWDVGGYEVLGAVRQSGYLAIGAAGQWHVMFGTLRGVRQVDELPEAVRCEQLVAGFKYDVQPFSLPLQLVPRRTRVSVEPEYLLLVDADQVSLQAKLRYNIRTAEVGSLQIEMPPAPAGGPAWQIDYVGPENVVAGVPDVDPFGVLSIPLAQRVLGQVELTLRAHRRAAPKSTAVQVALPRLRADSQSPATLVILPADDVELTPDNEASVGLVRQQIPPPMKLPPRQQDALFFRSEPQNAAFAAAVRVHPQKISASASTEVLIDEQRAQVRQRFSYTVSYRPADRLVLQLPREGLGAEPLEVSLDGKPLTLVDLPEPAGATKSPLTRKQAALPSARIGQFDVVVQYGVDLNRLLPKASVLNSIPLVMPADGQLTGNRVALAAKEGIQVRPGDGVWTPVESPAAPGRKRQGIVLAAPQRANHLAVGIQWDDAAAPGHTIVQRAWVQTWLTHAVRQDRAVFRLTTNQKSVELALPAGVALDDVRLWVDGKETAAPTPAENRLVVPLPSEGAGATHVLEVFYHWSSGRPDVGLMTLELPRIGNSAWVQREYWQLVLPRNEHVLVPPRELAAEFTWQWRGFFWERQTALDQAELEAWSAGRSQPDAPTLTNRYLFSSIGELPSCEVRTAHRATIVLASSAVVLALGLILIHVPVVRHPAALALVAVAAVAWSVLRPETMLLLAQASVLGAALACVSLGLQLALRRRPDRIPGTDLPSSVIERGSARTATYHPATVGNESPTEIRPAAASNAERET